MRRAFDLTFNTARGDFRLAVSMEKSFDERISFKTGYKGQPVKWIKVSTKDPTLEKVTSRKEISHVVAPDELESLWPTGEETEEGLPEFAVIDKKTLKNAFPSGPEMRVLQTVPLSAVPFHSVEGSHYFLSVKKTKKGKTRISNPEDVALYNLVYRGLKTNSEAFIVTYNAMNNIKHAVVYAQGKGLRLSNLIGSNLQRARKEKEDVSGDVDLKMYDRLVKGVRSDKMEEHVDPYGQRLEELVQATLKGEQIVHKDKPKLACIARLSALADDSDDEEGSKKKKKKMGSK